jgi:hypothetical protein
MCSGRRLSANWYNPAAASSSRETIRPPANSDSHRNPHRKPRAGPDIRQQQLESDTGRKLVDDLVRRQVDGLIAAITWARPTWKSVGVGSSPSCGLITQWGLLAAPAWGPMIEAPEGGRPPDRRPRAHNDRTHWLAGYSPVGRSTRWSAGPSGMVPRRWLRRWPPPAAIIHSSNRYRHKLRSAGHRAALSCARTQVEDAGGSCRLRARRHQGG